MGRITDEQIKQQKIKRVGEEKLNNQGCLMKIVEYNNSKDIIIEFQDEHKAQVRTSYRHFELCNIKNPYYPSVCGIGILGNKYLTKVNGKLIKEYITWKDIIHRCFDIKNKEKNPTYKNVICCDEWLLYENFYNWLHSQENFEKWHNEERWAIDKDILFKGNKFYSPETCCLVPMNVNNLFTKNNSIRGNLPIGVRVGKNGFISTCWNPFLNKGEYLGTYQTIEEAFQIYKTYKEKIIKQVAKIEYDKGNIIEICYNAMLNYKVEITD